MYVVIGASGYLGSYFVKNILKNTSEKIIATYNNNCGIIKDERVCWLNFDVGKFDSIKILIKKIQSCNEKCKIIYLSAYHKPDQVKKNIDFAWNINITGLSFFLSHISPYIGTLYYSSTEMVYGKSINGHIFSEEDILHPINEYGRQKMLAEKLVLEKGYNVVRYSVLMGKSITNKKHFTDIIIENVKNNIPIQMLADVYRNLIDFDQASKLAIQLIEKFLFNQIGIVNIVSDDIISKYAMALKLVERQGLNYKLIQPILNKENSFFSEQRANCLFVSNKKLKSLLNINKIKMKI